MENLRLCVLSFVLTNTELFTHAIIFRRVSSGWAMTDSARRKRSPTVRFESDRLAAMRSVRPASPGHGQSERPLRSDDAQSEPATIKRLSVVPAAKQTPVCRTRCHITPIGRNQRDLTLVYRTRGNPAPVCRTCRDRSACRFVVLYTYSTTTEYIVYDSPRNI